MMNNIFRRLRVYWKLKQAMAWIDAGKPGRGTKQRQGSIGVGDGATRAHPLAPPCDSPFVPTWEDCENLLDHLGYRTRVEVFACCFSPHTFHFPLSPFRLTILQLFVMGGTSAQFSVGKVSLSGRRAHSRTAA